MQFSFMDIPNNLNDEIKVYFFMEKGTYRFIKIKTRMALV